MQIQLRHQPSFAIARAQLAPGEGVRLESQAMVAISADMALESKMEGGFMKSIKRATLGGESFFMTTCTAGPQGGWVDIAPGLPGDIINVEVDPGTSWIVTRSSWLASATTVDLDTKWGGFSSLVGSEGGFVAHATGHGPLLVNCYGALDQFDVPPGQQFVLDTGHLVLMQDTVQFQLERAAAGWMNTIKSGEGFVFRITGPGRVFTQSRNPGWFSQFAPASHTH
ncbi:MAG: TIGR00266 family protein [Acidimicrobiales bacterium]